MVKSLDEQIKSLQERQAQLKARENDLMARLDETARTSRPPSPRPWNTTSEPAMA